MSKIVQRRGHRHRCGSKGEIENRVLLGIKIVIQQGIVDTEGHVPCHGIAKAPIKRGRTILLADDKALLKEVP